MYEILIALFIAIFAVLSLVNLRAAVYLTLIALPVYLLRFNVGPIPFTLLEAMILIQFVIWLFNREGYRKLTKSYLLGGGLLIMAASISVLVAPDTLAALGIWKAYFIEPILFFLVLRSVIQKPTHAHRVVATLGLGLLLVALFAVFQKLTGLAIPEPWDFARRVTSFFPYPNALGLYAPPIIVLGATALAHVLYKRRIFMGYFWIFTLAMAGLAIIFSQTEAAWVALPVTLWLISLLSIYTRWWTLPVGIIAVIVILSVPQISGPVFDKVLLQDYSGQVRLAQWEETVEFLKDEPLLGAGLSGYQTVIEPYHQASHIEIYEYPHNIILNTWVELGLLGLLALVVLAGTILKYAYQGLRNPSAPRWLVLGCLGALLVMFIHGLVDVPYFKNDLAVLTWSILALLAFTTTYEK